MNTKIVQAIRTIWAKKADRVNKTETNAERTKHLCRRVPYGWEYKGAFIRGMDKFLFGVPHVFKNTSPRYLLSKNELRKYGLKPGAMMPIFHTYNEHAGVHYLYDVRDCVRIAGPLAAARLDAAIANVRGEGTKRGREVLLQVLREQRDIPF